VATVVVDANLVVSLITPDERRDSVRTLFAAWTVDGTGLAAPPHFYAEVLSTLRRKVFRGQITPEEGETAVRFYFSLVLTRESPPALQPLAWQLAKDFNLPTTYDTEYMALARLLACEFYTADERFVRSLGAAKPDWVRFIA